MFGKAKFTYQGKLYEITVIDHIYMKTTIRINDSRKYTYKKIELGNNSLSLYKVKVNDLDNDIIFFSKYINPFKICLHVTINSEIVFGNNLEFSNYYNKIIKKVKNARDDINQLPIINWIKYGYLKGLLFMIIISIFDSIFNELDIIKSISMGIIFGLLFGYINLSELKKKINELL